MVRSEIKAAPARLGVMNKDGIVECSDMSTIDQDAEDSVDVLEVLEELHNVGLPRLESAIRCFRAGIAAGWGLERFIRVLLR